MRKTKIICTIGPATGHAGALAELCEAGMDVVRLNMSHGDHDTHRAVIQTLRELNADRDHPVPILLDTQGPEIRTGDLADDLKLQEGTVITVSVRGDQPVEQSSFQINYDDLLTAVAVGDRITVDNGLINLEVLSKGERTLECKVVDGGVLKSKRHVNLPGVRINLPAITEKDERDIDFGIAEGVDFIALSFVREAADVMALRERLGMDGDGIRIIAKIEDQEGVRNLDDIIDTADGIMVARGDLGVEVAVQELPNIQRRIVQRCAEQGKRVIVATHLLESMIENPMPTRAEVTDVANAVYEEVDAVMLSGETTVGKYPVKSVEYLDRIAQASERGASLKFYENLQRRHDKQHLAVSAVQLAEAIGARGIVVITQRGRVANYVTNAHPQQSIIYAFTQDARTQRQLKLNRNLLPFRIAFDDDPEVTLARAFATLLDAGACRPRDKVVVISDVLTTHSVDAIQLRYLPERDTLVLNP